MKVLVFAVHPDDETLGAGGALLRHIQNKDEVFWTICTEPSKEWLKKKPEYEQIRTKQIKKVFEAFPFKNLDQLPFNTTELDKYPTNELVDAINKVMNQIKPDIVYIPFCGDVHSDHRVIFNAIWSCTKSFRYPFIKKILMMETVSETEFSSNIEPINIFNPNYFVNISDQINRKLEILSMYETEISLPPFPRSLENVKALATFRGSTSQCLAAESFMLLKEIII